MATATVLASGAFLISIITSAGKALFSGTTFPLTFISKAHGMLLFLQLSQEGTEDRMMSPSRGTWAINYDCKDAYTADYTLWFNGNPLQ